MKPDIWIWVSVKNEQFRYKMKFLSENPISIEGPKISDVARIERKLRKSLKRFGEVISCSNNSRKIQSFITDFQKHGQDLHETLLGNLDEESCNSFKRLMEWSVLLTEAEQSPLRIEVELPSNCNFPLEYVFLQPADSDYPYDILKRFVGSAFLIHYVTPYQRLGNLELNNIPKLPMKLFICNNDSPNCGDTLRFFDLNREHFDFCFFPWTQEEIQDFPCKLSKLISRVDRTCHMGFRDVPDQIHHFCCILTRISPDKGDCKLRFSHRSEARTDELIQHCRGLVINSPDKDRPFVFLNICNHSKVWSINRTSIPDFFLRTMSSRGFICIEDIIPESFSTKFSKRLYYYLLQKETLGEALHQAKWDFLRWQHNLLGILYKLYAHPDIQVSHMVAPVDIKGVL